MIEPLLKVGDEFTIIGQFKRRPLWKRIVWRVFLWRAYPSELQKYVITEEIKVP